MDKGILWASLNRLRQHLMSYAWGKNKEELIKAEWLLESILKTFDAVTPLDDSTAISWHHFKGDRVYALNPQTLFTQRYYRALDIQPKPFHHRSMRFSRVTGEQIEYEVVKRG